MKRAIQSGVLVSSLLPEDVIQNLYEEHNQKLKRQQLRKRYGNRDGGNLNQQEDTEQYKQVIAQLYPETTVFFGHLAGFTKWSSSRSPLDVFLLLETLESSKIFHVFHRK